MPSLTHAPARFSVGDTVSWRKTFSDYPASAGWSLVYSFINATARVDIAAAVADGDAFVTTITAVVSAGYTPGRVQYVGVVTLGANRHTVDSGVWDILPNLSVLTAFEVRSAAREALDAINAALRVYGAKAWQQSYTIGGRSQTFRGVDEFLRMRDRLAAEVAGEDNAERLAHGLQSRNKLYVRFAGGR